jgi:hypothetical protein
MVLAGAGEFNLAHLSKVSEAFYYVSVAAVHQHVSQDSVEVDGQPSAGILFENVE